MIGWQVKLSQDYATEQHQATEAIFYQQVNFNLVPRINLGTRIELIKRFSGLGLHKLSKSAFLFPPNQYIDLLQKRHILILLDY